MSGFLNFIFVSNKSKDESRLFYTIINAYSIDITEKEINKYSIELSNISMGIRTLVEGLS